jgi:prepilin-type N-terminal cleavage/methylation domain-containing protein
MKVRASRQRGYTAVELMMAIGIFGVGVTGIISMQKVTSVSNQHAKNLSIATNIAESWLDMLTTDAARWTAPSRSGGAKRVDTTTWLSGVKPNASGAGNWFLPIWDPGLQFGPAFDALGNPVNPATGTVAFCSHLRLSWLYQPTNDGNGLIRAEVRVFWLRDGQGFAQNMCAVGQAASVGSAPQTFHFVQKITSIRENSQ